MRSLRFRILASFLAALIAMLAAVGFLVVRYQEVATSQALITNGYLPLSKTIDRVQVDQRRVNTNIERLYRQQSRPNNSIFMSIFTDEMRENLQIAQIHTTQARQIASSGEEYAILNKSLAQLILIEEQFRVFQAHTMQVVEASTPPIDEALLEARFTEWRQHQLRLDDEIHKLGRQIDGRIDTLTTTAEAQRIRATAIASMLAVLAVVLTLISVVVVFLSLQPIGRLTTQVKRLAQGDYTSRVDVRGSDEISILATQFNSMVHALEIRDQTLVTRADQLKRLSGYLTSVLHSMEDGFFVREEGRITLTNPAATNIWNIQENQDVPAHLLPPTGRAGRFEVHDEKGRLHEVRVTPFGEDGIIVVSADITEQTEAKERLARTERLALVGQMFAQVTHEIRNPLNALSLNAELLNEELKQMDKEGTSEAGELFETISQEIHRLTQLTEQYLQVSRRPSTQRDQEDLSEIVTDVIRLIRPELKQKKIKLTTSLPDTPCVLCIDGNQIRQSLLNIIRNAMEANSTTLALSLSVASGQASLRLDDNGKGMTPEQIDRACDPFFSTNPKGSGLGLAITRQIVEEHGGNLIVNSEPDVGSSLTLVLPYYPEQNDEPIPSSPTPSPHS